jgi:glycosyltransferase involved in cell wall biosynthesis
VVDIVEAGQCAPAAPGERRLMTPRISIVIKAFNEEAYVAGAIRSALRALKGFPGEVILADSASTDRTVAIASEFPIVVVQLADPRLRRCGVGPQLGFQYASGDYVYILDGDMQLERGFLERAVEVMEADPSLAGVGGLVDQLSTASYQFRGLRRRRAESRPGEVRWLDMGGLYRRSALEHSGYFSNRNLHAFEEMELGLRLCAAGWKLRRLDVPGVRHHGYDVGSLALLRQRWKSRYLQGSGEVLRACWRRPYFFRALAAQKYLLLGLAIWLGAAVGLLLLPYSAWPIAVVGAALLGLILLRMWRTRSVADALVGQLVWQVHALAMVRGLFAPAVDPRRPLPARVLQQVRCPNADEREASGR